MHRWRWGASIIEVLDADGRRHAMVYERPSTPPVTDAAVPDWLPLLVLAALVIGLAAGWLT